MAESNITKRALAQALKDLMKTRPFEKISVAEICQACEMKRQSFYYHFKDKYDLVEWIFETEFVELMAQSGITDRWVFLDGLCRYFYQERAFYVNAMSVTGQNSFQKYCHDYLVDMLEPFVRTNFCEDLAGDETLEFYANFISDSILVAIFRWLTDGVKLPPDRFVELLESMTEMIRKKAEERNGAS